MKATLLAMAVATALCASTQTNAAACNARTAPVSNGDAAATKDEAAWKKAESLGSAIQSASGSRTSKPWRPAASAMLASCVTSVVLPPNNAQVAR